MSIRQRKRGWFGLDQCVEEKAASVRKRRKRRKFDFCLRNTNFFKFYFNTRLQSIPYEFVACIKF